MIKQKIKKVLSLLKKIIFSKSFMARLSYGFFRNTFKVNNKFILYESYHGESMSGNPYALYKFMLQNDKYKEYTHIWILSSIDKVKKQRNTKLIKRNSIKNSYYLIVSKYLINNTTFLPFFIKKDTQIYINTWHGTPLKAMGKNMAGNPLAFGNVQRNFIQADIVSLPNIATVNMANDDYILKNTGLDNIQLNASPRNSVFFDLKRRNELKSILKVSPDKTLVLWMPTWRGIATDLNNIQKNIAIFKRMAKIIEKLNKSIVIYVKPHPLMYSKLDLDELELRLVPKDIDIYDFANITDALLTDYSSVMFDYANLNKPIILDIFDIEEYIEDRGISLDIDTLPFVKTSNETELLNALNNLDSTEVNYAEFNKKYNLLENIDAPKQLLEKIFALDTQSKKPEKKKEKVLIYPGSMLTNGITTSFLNLMSNIDKTKRDYIVWLPNNMVKIKNLDNVKKFTSLDIDYISSPTGIIFNNIKEISVYSEFLNRNILNKKQKKVLSTIMQRESIRCFGNIEFDHIIHFTGYESFVAEVFKEMNGKLHIWLHSNMKEEAELRNNYNVNSIETTYDVADTIAVVNDNVKKVLLDNFFSEANKKKVVSVHNTANIDDVITKANFKEAYMTDTLHTILEDKESIKFINIGRFSPEKGHVRLIEAFSKLRENNPSKKASLFIIAGHGIDYPKVMDAKENSKFKSDIYLFENINPFPILKKSDLMVMSSYYEGQPMVFFESLALNVPILSTSIPGPKEFLESGYGYTCENSTEGLIEGMQNFLDGKFNKKIKDINEFNQNAIDEFESIFHQ